ncbi:hypothetical protein [Pseudoalteromonas ostreae]|nr:hypothetical protein [Pseudoalteromonas ostreae]
MNPDRVVMQAMQVEPAELLRGLRQTIRESGAIYKFSDSEKLISEELG